MSLFDRVAELRTQSGLSQNSLEREVGLPRNTICKWDKSIPSADKLKLVADYFNVSIEYLLTGETKEKPGISAELSDAHRVLIDRVMQMSDEQASAFLRALDAFQGIQ
jgi:transcriptional regulator with XRE-family HTH domain